MRTRAALGPSRTYDEGRRSGPVAGRGLLVETVQQDRLEACGVPDSSDNATSLPRTGLDGPPTIALDSAES